jgi:hypothetical protein
MEDPGVGMLKDVVDLLISPARWFYGLWNAPSLEIDFNVTQEPWVGAVDDAGGQQGWFYRLEVTNKGRSPAEDCVAALVFRNRSYVKIGHGIFTCRGQEAAPHHDQRRGSA